MVYQSLNITLTVWQMRDDVDNSFNVLLEKLVSLAHSNSNKVPIETKSLNITLTRPIG